MFNYSKYNLGLEGFDFGTLGDTPLFWTKTQILRPYVSPTNVKSSEQLQKYYNKFGYNYGVDLVPYNDLSSLTKSDYSITTYSPALGVVLDIVDYRLQDGKYNKAVVIQFDANTSFRVANLNSVDIHRGDGVAQGDIIGTAEKYVHFEMLTYKKEFATAQTYVFRKLRLFVSNPMPYFSGYYNGTDTGIGD